MTKRTVFYLVCVILLVVPAAFIAQASTPPIQSGTPVEMIGTVTDIQSPTDIRVNDTLVKLSAVSPAIPLQIGVTVELKGELNANNTITANDLEITDKSPEEVQIIGFVEAIQGTLIIVGGHIVETSTAERKVEIALGIKVKMTARPAANGGWAASKIDDNDDDDDDDLQPGQVILIGTVRQINATIVTISNQAIDTSDNPTDAPLFVGVRVRTKIQFTNGKLVAITKITLQIGGNDDDNGTTKATEQATPDDDDDDFGDVDIVIEGPVTAININIITIYDFDIQLRQDDDVLKGLKIGDLLRVEGNFQRDGATVIVVAVNVAIVNIEVNVNSGGGGSPPAGGGAPSGGGNGGGGDDDDD